MVPILAAAWPVVKTYWKPIVIGLVVVAALGYVKALHMEIDHYKSKVVQLEKEKALVQEKNNLLEHNATELSKKYARQLENKLLEEQKKAKLVQERIKKDEESKRINLSANVVELFNAGKPDDQPAPTTERKDDAKTSTDSKTLNDLLSITATNDANHKECIETVLEWQNFWTDYSSGVKAIGGSP